MSVSLHLHCRSISGDSEFPPPLSPPFHCGSSLTHGSLRRTSKMLARLLSLTALALVTVMVSADCPDAQFICSRPINGATDHVSSMLVDDDAWHHGRGLAGGTGYLKGFAEAQHLYRIRVPSRCNTLNRGRITGRWQQGYHHRLSQRWHPQRGQGQGRREGHDLQHQRREPPPRRHRRHYNR
jgi:hypothetical protein